MLSIAYAGVLKSIGLPEGLAQAIASWDIGVSKGDLFDDGKVLSKLIGHPTTYAPNNRYFVL